MEKSQTLFHSLFFSPISSADRQPASTLRINPLKAVNLPRLFLEPGAFFLNAQLVARMRSYSYLPRIAVEKSLRKYKRATSPCTAETQARTPLLIVM